MLRCASGASLEPWPTTSAQSSAGRRSPEGDDVPAKVLFVNRTQSKQPGPGLPRMKVGRIALIVIAYAVGMYLLVHWLVP